ncbi:hypothetical protein [Spirosoma pomorum]
MQNIFYQPKWQLLKTIGLSTALGVLVGCQDLNDIKNIDPLKGVVFKLNYEPAKTLMQGLVVDAKTGMQLDVPITVSVFGPDASRVITYEGVSTTSFKNEKGDIFIGLIGSVPSTAKPAELRVVVDAPGYIGSSQYLTIREAKPEPFSIRLVKEDAPPVGVAISTETVETNSTGVVKTAEVISTPITNSNSTQVTVELPAGTQLKDEKGQAVTGNLSAAVAAYSSQNQSSLSAFPGGFETRVSRDNQGQTNSAGSFATAGFASIEIASSSGQKVANFSQPVKVEMEVSKALINPETNAPVKVGDKIPVFSYNENTGEWIYERDAVVKSEQGELQVELEITHLSWYNLDWFYTGRNCDTGGWTITGKPDGQAVRWVLFRGDSYYSSGISYENSVNFYYPFPGQARLELFALNGSKIGSSTVNSICGNNSVAVNYPQLVDTKVKVLAYCENNNNVQISPSTWVYYRKAGSSDPMSVAYFTAGQGTLTGLEPNTNYEAGVYYNGFQSRVINSGNQSGNQVVEIIFKKNVTICSGK